MVGKEFGRGPQKKNKEITKSDPISMPELQICNFCELFGFNSVRNPVGRLPLRIGSDVYPPEFEFVAGNKYGTVEVAKHLDDLALVYYDEANVLVLHMFVPDGTGQALVNCTPEKRLYRYGKLKYLRDARDNGHFLVFPALEYIKKEYDAARKDNELVHKKNVPADSVSITTKDNTRIVPVGDITFSTVFLPIDSYILCFSYDYDEGLYDEFEDSEACLIVQDVKEFAKRIHGTFAKAMPSHLGVDGRVAYGKHQSSLGVLFSKPKDYVYQREYRFAWIPEIPKRMLDPTVFVEDDFDKIRSIVPPPVEIEAGPLADISSLIERKGRT